MTLPTEHATRKDWEDLIGMPLKTANKKFASIKVDGDLAETLRGYAPYYQRKLVDANLNSIKDDMNSGAYQGLAVCALALVVPASGISPSGVVEGFLINGNHTTQAIADTRKEQTLDFRIHVVADKDEVQRLYAAYDQGKARSVVAVNKALNHTMAVGKRMGSIVIGASQWGAVGLNPGAYSIFNGRNFAKAAWAKQYEAEALQLEPFYEGLYKVNRDVYKMARRSVIAANLLLILKKGTAAQKSELSKLLDSLSKIAAGEQKFAPNSQTSALYGVWTMINKDENSLPKGRSSLAWGIIRSLEAYLAGDKVPAKLEELTAPITPSKPAF